jgi:predicted nucleotidyltransferase
MSEPSLTERIQRELPHLSLPQVEELAQAVQRLVQAFHPERIYVFGSQARGTPRPDSDIDLLVVVPSSNLPGYRRDQEAYQALGWHSLPLEIIVMTRAEFDERLPALASLPATVAREGRLLYAA